MVEDRRLAAIMFTDIVGYTKLMGSDEDKAFDMLARNHIIHETLIKKHNGTLIKEIGDGTLASFPLASNAVRCAMDIQKEAKSQKIPLKIGIHEGEMVFVGTDVLGDGVNVASRLEEFSQEGCITISGTVQKDIKNKAGINTKFIGDKKLKNVDDPVKVYEVLCQEEAIKDETTKGEESQKARNKLPYYIIAGMVVMIAAILIWKFLPIKDKDSQTTEVTTEEVDKTIAILPFADLSPEGDQEHFSVGMTVEITSNLGKIKDLQVTSNLSVMRYKNTDLSIKDIASELGVAYVMGGSVRKSGNKLKIYVELINGITDKLVWDETYDRQLSEIFEIQSDVAKKIASSLSAEIYPDVEQRIESIPTSNLEAYSLFLKAREVGLFTEDAQEYLLKAIKLDPEFADGYIYLGITKLLQVIFSRNYLPDDINEYLNEVKDLLNKGLELDPANATANLWLGSLCLWFEWDFNKAEKYYIKAYELEPALPFSAYSEFLLSTGQFKDALANSDRIIESNRNSESEWLTQGLCYYFLDNQPMVSASIKVFKSQIGQNEYRLSSLMRLLVYQGTYDEAQTIFESISDDQMNPRILSLAAIAYYHNGEHNLANEILNKLTLQSKQSSIGSPSFYLATIYAQMGEAEKAFNWLEKAYFSSDVRCTGLR